MQDQQQPILTVENISFQYPDHTLGLDGVSLTIKQGEFFSILGANGAGKTTLLKILNGLLKPSSGRVLFRGNDLSSLDKNFLFSHICTVFQDPNDQLFAQTVEQDISYGPYNQGLPEPEVRLRVKKALELVGMAEAAQKSIRSLSYGQKKRICLAGVLAMQPEVMILDEPTSGLDPMGVSSIMRLLKKLNQEEGITMIMATHVVDLVPLFINRLAILRRGKMVQVGTPEDIFNDPSMVRGASLRLPRIAHLLEILKKEDHLEVEKIPLTIGEARRTIVNLIAKRRQDAV
ncbi:MAG: ATP-binding cassette domain-containing protein [bacterium]|nr:ATP-binding cassette domain-containing protein [bacterium]